MKILLLSALYSPNFRGGAEKVVQSLAEGLLANGHRVTVATSQPTGADTRARVNNVDVRYLRVRNVYRPFDGAEHRGIVRFIWHALDSRNRFMAKRVGELFEEVRPDVVHTHSLTGFSPSIWPMCKAHRLPVVHTLHDYYLLCPRTSRFRANRNCTACLTCRPYALVRCRATRYVDACIGVSRHILDVHKGAQLFASSIKRVIYNAYAGDISTAPRTIHQPVRIGYLGRLSVPKGVTRLIDAFRALPSGIAELWIAGEGERGFVNALKSQGTCDNIHWLGFLAPETLLDSIDILVVPSLWHDPAPLVVQEGLARGLAVIGSRRGGIAELIGNAGWLYEPDEDGALASTLARAINDRTKIASMQDSALNRAHLFPASAWIDAHEEVYLEVIRNNTST